MILANNLLQLTSTFYMSNTADNNGEGCNKQNWKVINFIYPALCKKFQLSLVVRFHLFEKMERGKINVIMQLGIHVQMNIGEMKKGKMQYMIMCW